MSKVVLIDDETEILKDRSKIIESFGFECFTANNGKKGIEIIKTKKPDVVLTDLKMPVNDGFFVLEKTREIDPDLPVIIFTGFGTIESAVKALNMGAYDYLQKPFSIDLMEMTLRKAINFRTLKIENLLLRSQVDTVQQLKDFVGESKVIHDIAKRVKKAALSEANVLIYGESGTGKELIARNIHYFSQRSKKPFIAIDCVSLPPTLIESEIFGFERGAFTDAKKLKPRLIELADGGTLFLDEIAELDLKLQAKLLRVLQERQFRRLGSTEIKQVNVRIISATNINPETAIKEKKLRTDLYYRLNVVPINIPPLRERKEDIPILVNHFIKFFNSSSQIQIQHISSEALSLLQMYDWPGNVRELQNVIEKTIALADEETIKTEDLPEKIKINAVPIDEESLNKLTYKEAKDQFLQKFNHQYFSNMLKKYDGNISKVARDTGVSRWTIYRIFKNADHEPL